jgi:hypothetical protein
MAEHELKVWPDYFKALASGHKTFEIRKNDRDYQRGDTLILREYAPGPDEYTGFAVKRTVSYILSGDDVMGFAFGLRSGFVAMGLADDVSTTGEPQ